MIATIYLFLNNVSLFCPETFVTLSIPVLRRREPRERFPRWWEQWQRQSTAKKNNRTVRHTRIFRSQVLLRIRDNVEHDANYSSLISEMSIRNTITRRLIILHGLSIHPSILPPSSSPHTSFGRANPKEDVKLVLADPTRQWKSKTGRWK